MIKEIVIRNYKIFKGLHRIPLATNSTSPVTVFSTVTASGKTTLIEAVYWCLYGHTMGMHDVILNYERQQEMKCDEIETVDVELIFEHDGETQSFSRSFGFRKVNNEVIHCQHFDRCSIPTEKLFPAEAIAPAMFLTEPLGLNSQAAFSKIISRTVDRYLRQYPIREKTKYFAIKQAIMTRVAVAASMVFNELYFREGAYNIVWSDDFSLVRIDQNDMHMDCLSATDQLIFNIALLHGLRETLVAKTIEPTTFPIFIDDIFSHVDTHQFSLDKFVQTLSRWQIVVLAHENNLRDQSLSSYCGTIYTMYRNSDWTNIDITQSTLV